MRTLNLAARSTALLASAGLLVLWWALVFRNPYGRQGATAQSDIVPGVMALTAGVGILAALRDWPRLLVAASVVSLVPVGLYLLGTPGIFKPIGYLGLLLLISGSLSLAAHGFRRNRERGGGG